jgi:hypothetical protein
MSLLDCRMRLSTEGSPATPDNKSVIICPATGPMNALATLRTVEVADSGIGRSKSLTDDEFAKRTREPL